MSAVHGIFFGGGEGMTTTTLNSIKKLQLFVGVGDVQFLCGVGWGGRQTRVLGNLSPQGKNWNLLIITTLQNFYSFGIQTTILKKFHQQKTTTVLTCVNKLQYCTGMLMRPECCENETRTRPEAWGRERDQNNFSRPRTRPTLWERERDQWNRVVIWMSDIA